MNTKNLAAKLLLCIGGIAACAAMTTGAAMPFASVARDYSPRNQVAAAATATAIPLVNEPTRTYQEQVLPTLQAVEAQEIVATTHQRYENKRTASTAWLWFRIGLACVLFGAVVVYAARWSVIWIKQAVEHEPYQVLPDKPLYFPRRAQVTHTLTGASWSMLTEHAADTQHGQLLVQGRDKRRYRFAGRAQRMPDRVQVLAGDAVRLGAGVKGVRGE